MKPSSCHGLRLLVTGGLLLAALSVGTPALLAVQLLPGVHGYGTDRSINSAGFGQNAQVLSVTNLNNSGTGSLRAALSASGRRVVVFEVGGIIKLESTLTISNPDITIAGQTAPYPGISVHGAMLVVNADNVLIQHLRFRTGDDWLDGGATNNRDSIRLANGVSNVVVDHCTFAWSLDEMAEAYGSYDNITFNKCIFAEPLFQSIHIDEGTHAPGDSSSNKAQNADTLQFDTDGFSSNPQTQSHGDAIGGSYHSVPSNSTGDYIEYEVPLVSPSGNRKNRHVVISGVTGNNRGRFRIQVRNSSNTIIKDYTSSDTYIDQYSSSPAYRTWVVDTPADGGGFSIPSGSGDHLKIRLIVVGKHGSSTNYTMGIDLIAISDEHSMGGLFSSGVNLPGRLSIIGSVYSSLSARGPWVNSKSLVFANNVLYNRRNVFTHFGSDDWDDAYHAAVLANTYIEGPSWPSWADGNPPISLTEAIPNSAVYAPSLAEDASEGNAYDYGNYSSPPALRSSGLNASSDPTDKTQGMGGFVPLTASAAYEDTLNGAGARPAERDPHEERIITEIRSAETEDDLSARLGSLKNRVDEADAGLDDHYDGDFDNGGSWTPAMPGSAIRNQVASSGYTYLEEWLHQLAAVVEGSGGGTPDPDAPVFDNFEDGNANGWTPTGTTSWSVVQVGTSGTPEHNSVYQQSDTTGDAGAILNGTNWGTQVIQADITATSFNGTNRWFGLVGRYQDSGNYYYFILRDSDVIDLKKQVNGTFSSLLSTTPSYTVTPGTTYRMRLTMNGSSISGTVSTWNATTKAWTNVQNVNATDSSHTSGQAGVAMYRATVQVNNVQATSTTAPTTLFVDDFQDQVADGWSTTGGTSNWSVVSSGGSYVYRQSTATTVDAVYAYAGNASWTDQVVEAATKANSFDGSNRFFGLLARYTDTDSYYYFILRSNNTVQLKKYVNGVQGTLDTASFNVSTGSIYDLRLEAVGSTLNGYVNGQLVVEAQDTGNPEGMAGMKLYYTAAEFDDVLVSEP